LTNPVAQAARDRVMPILAGLEVVQQKVRGIISELAVQYSGSPIVEENPLGSGPRAGERAPNGIVQDTLGAEKQLFSLLAGIEHKLLIFEPLKPAPGQAELNSAASVEAKNRFAERVKIFRITTREATAAEGEDAAYCDAGGSLHERYGARRGAVYLIRPDGYVGFRCPADGAAEKLNAYLNRTY